MYKSDEDQLVMESPEVNEIAREFEAIAAPTSFGDLPDNLEGENDMASLMDRLDSMAQTVNKFKYRIEVQEKPVLDKAKQNFDVIKKDRDADKPFYDEPKIIKSKFQSNSAHISNIRIEQEEVRSEFE